MRLSGNRKYIVLAATVILTAVILIAGVLIKMTPDEVAGSINVAASIAGTPAMEELVKAFREEYPGVEVEMGTYDNVDVICHRLLVGQEDAVIAYQHPNQRFLNDGTTFTIIAKDQLRVIVHPSNPLETITEEQAKKVFLSEVLDWEDAGGAEGRIRPVAYREDNTVTSIFMKMVDLDILHYSDRVTRVESFDEMVSIISQDPESIGYIFESQLPEGKVKALSFPEEKPVEWCFVYRTREQNAALKAFTAFAKKQEAGEVFKKYFDSAK